MQRDPIEVYHHRPSGLAFIPELLHSESSGFADRCAEA
jgi:hypothetical protein